VIKRPEFEILRPIVISDTVLVMDALTRLEIAADLLFHDEAMFEYVRSFSSAR